VFSLIMGVASLHGPGCSKVEQKLRGPPEAWTPEPPEVTSTEFCRSQQVPS
jgi:hypothetical protein